MSFLADNLLNPPLLFFILGMAAVLVKSDLELPQPFPKILSLYLLFAIGFKGGVELSHSGVTPRIAMVLGAAVMMALVVPVYSFFLLRGRVGVDNAAAIAATYGSISAVTFITAGAFLNATGIGYSGYLVAAMALMESPAIVVGVLLYRMARRERSAAEKTDWPALLRDSFFNGSVFLLTGSLLIGAATGEKGWEAVSPLTDGLFKGVLCLFLLDMGIVAARRLGVIRKAGLFLAGFSVGVPLVNAALAIGLSRLMGLDRGDALMFTVLCASASYIAVPAAMRLAVPKANPSYYVTMALALTFPFNVLVGIPICFAVISRLWG
ncbi:MAG: uncharacterized protein PWP23_1819 [Candidatus Sumerlaeota bacterium]|nr:uncharacterized protein [Candidatus Sumerlaeota bacterium]